MYTKKVNITITIILLVVALSWTAWAKSSDQETSEDLVPTVAPELPTVVPTITGTVPGGPIPPVTPDPEATPETPVIPVDIPLRDSLPVCDLSTPNENTGPPDPSGMTVCKVESTPIDTTDMEGFPLPWGWDSPAIEPTKTPTSTQSVSPAAVAVHPNYSWAINHMNCQGACDTGSNTISTIYAEMTALLPGLPYLYSWNSYHYYNRFHIQDYNATSTSCSNYSLVRRNMSMGLAYGRIGQDIYNDGKLHLYWEKYVPTTGQCFYPFSTTVTLNYDQYLPIRMGQFTSGGNKYWYGDAYLNGSWSNVFQVNWGSGTVNIDSLDAGHEIWAAAQDKNYIYAPINSLGKMAFMKNSTLGLLPWDDNLQGVNSGQNVDSEFTVLDVNYGTDYTSVVATANIN